MKGITIRKNSLPELLTVGKFEVGEPWIHRRRQLDIHTMILVTEGTLFISEDGVDYEVAKDHLFFFEAGREQVGYRKIQAGSGWYWVSFTPQLEGDNDIELPKLTPITDEIRQKVVAMAKLYKHHSPFGTERLQGMLYSLFFDLLSMEKQIATAGGIYGRVMAVLETQIETDYDSDLIANELNMTYSYIGQRFKEESGQTIHQAYDQLKVNRAKHLLQMGSMNITQVSEALAYPNPYYFSRVFKKVTGLAPRTYMKQMYL